MKRASTLVGAAGLLVVLTVLARIVGFGRIFVFSGSVGYNRVGDVYQTINTIPNIVFEIAAGGALASVVVPLLSAAVAEKRAKDVNRTASALLTWAVTVLTPLAVIVVLAARPLADLVLSHPPAAERAYGSALLVMFAPQLVLYGVGIVLTGVLQSHHRFAGPALAPLLSSVTVIGAYLLYAGLGGGTDVGGLTRTDELVLGLGTTAGVLVLSLCLLVPLRATGVRLRPTYRFPPGAAVRARGLVGSGLLTVAGQQIALLVVLLLAQPPAPAGSVLTYNVAQTVFLLPWAVLAVPLATSAFPRMSAAWDGGEPDRFRHALGVATRSVLLVALLGAAALAALAAPVAEVLTGFGRGGDPDTVAAAIALFAPGLVGYSLLAVLSRALYAAGAAGPAGIVTIGGWGVVVAADIVLAAILPAQDRVPALAAGHSVGMTVLGAGLLVVTARRVGAIGIGARSVLAGLAAAALAGGLGWLVTVVLPGPALVRGLAGGVVLVAVFAGVVFGLDRAGIRSLRERTPA